MKKRNAGTLRSGHSKKKVTSRKQAIAIGLVRSARRGQESAEEGAKKDYEEGRQEVEAQSEEIAHRHCEERSDEAIQSLPQAWIASLRSQ